MNDRLIVLGTGNANVTHCYNTCFAIDTAEGLLLCDAGGGSGILRQLEVAGIGWEQIHHLILTHAHTDHILGAVWVIRMIATRMNNGKYEGDLHIYCSSAVREGLVQMAQFTLQKKMTDRLGDRIHFHEIADGSRETMLGREVTFFDIRSTKMQQHGFTMPLSGGRKLCCLGDEPYNPDCRAYVENADWLLCEAFCLYGDRERFKPYEKHHSTVKEACELAQGLHIPNLVLWHTEDKTIAQRKQRYTEEGRQYYTGRLFVPDDLDVIELDGRINFDNHDSRIRFVDLLLERSLTQAIPQYELPEGYRFEYYQPGDRDSWIDIECSARELVSHEQGVEVWQQYYGKVEHLLHDRMLFVVNAEGAKIATATAYPTDEPGLGQVHWVAVKREEQERGIAKALMTRVLQVMHEHGDTRAMLHTQTVTWVAVRMYLNLGFRPTAQSAQEHAEGWRIIRTLTHHAALEGIEPASMERVLH